MSHLFSSSSWGLARIGQRLLAAFERERMIPPVTSNEGCPPVCSPHDLLQHVLPPVAEPFWSRGSTDVLPRCLHPLGGGKIHEVQVALLPYTAWQNTASCRLARPSPIGAVSTAENLAEELEDYRQQLLAMAAPPECPTDASQGGLLFMRSATSTRLLKTCRYKHACKRPTSHERTDERPRRLTKRVQNKLQQTFHSGSSGFGSPPQQTR